MLSTLDRGTWSWISSVLWPYTVSSVLSMLDEQTSKKFKVVVWRESEGSLLGFLGFGFSLLLAFPAASCFRGILCELNDELDLEAVSGNVLFIRHDRTGRKKVTCELRVLGSWFVIRHSNRFFFAILYIYERHCKDKLDEPRMFIALFFLAGAQEQNGPCSVHPRVRWEDSNSSYSHLHKDKQMLGIIVDNVCISVARWTSSFSRASHNKSSSLSDMKLRGVLLLSSLHVPWNLLVESSRWTRFSTAISSSMRTWWMIVDLDGEGCSMPNVE